MKFRFTDKADFVKNDPVLAGGLSSEDSYHSQDIVLRSKITPQIQNKFGIAYLNTSMAQQHDQLGHVNTDIDYLIVRNHLNMAVGKKKCLLLLMLMI